MDCIICRYGELALKGKNRNLFEKRLIKNMKDCLQRNKLVGDIINIRGRIIINTTNANIIDYIKNIFGLVSISPAVVCSLDFDEIKSTANSVVENKLSQNLDKNKINSFRISSSRSNKQFHLTSLDLDMKIGEFIMNKFNLKVSLKAFDLNLGIEIHDKAFVFTEKIKCPGGIPLGMSGNVCALIQNKNDLAAAWLMSKRGCIIYPVSMNASSNKQEFVSSLANFTYGQNLDFELVTNNSELNQFVKDHQCLALVSGTTLDNNSSFEKFNQEFSDIDIPILFPIIAYSDEEINFILIQINKQNSNVI